MSHAETTRKLYAAFGRGDLETIINQCSETVEWGEDVLPAEIPVSGMRHGRAGVAKYFQDLMATYEIKHFDPHTMVAEGPHVVTFITVDSVMRKTGVPVKGAIVQHATYNDQGQIQRFHIIHTDVAQVIAAWHGETAKV